MGRSGAERRRTPSRLRKVGASSARESSRSKFLVVLGVILLLMVLFLYLVLPGLIESRLAADLQESYGLAQEPEVEVSSSFPPELLLGRVDRIEVRMDQLRREGILLRNVRLDLEEVDVSLGGLLRGDLEEARTGSLVAEAPETSINEYLLENDLGLEGGEIDILPQGAVYRSADAFLGLPASVLLDLRVAGPHEIEVIPQEVAVAGIELPPFFTRSLAAGEAQDTTAELDEALGTFENSLGLLQAVSPGEEEDTSEALEQIEAARQALEEVQEAQQAGPQDIQETSGVSDLEESLGSLQTTLAGLPTGVSPEVLASPLALELTNLANPPGIVGFYAPGVLGLLVQHIALSLASLAVIRERLGGTYEFFEVSPLGPGELLAGKFVTYFGLEEEQLSNQPSEDSASSKTLCFSPPASS